MRQSSIRFNAGKVQYDEDTKKCVPLPHNGYISIVPAADDPDFLSFTWKCKDTTVGEVENDELVLIPGDVTFKHVSSCTTGRVFALTFLSSGTKHLYWLQDVGDIDQLGKLTDKDKNILKDVTEAITLEDDEDMEIDNVADNNTEGGNDTESKSPSTASSNATVSMDPPAVTMDNASVLAKMLQNLQSVSIGDLLSVEEVERHLDSLSPEELQENYGSLMPGAMSASKQDILDVVRCGFFSQAHQRLSESVKGNGSILVAQALGYDYKGAGVENMMRGLREKGKENQQQDNENAN